MAPPWFLLLLLCVPCTELSGASWMSQKLWALRASPSNSNQPFLYKERKGWSRGGGGGLE